MDPRLELLTGDAAGELLAAAIRPAGGRLLSWAPAQVDHARGFRTTVAYRTTVRWPDGDAEETLLASAGRRVADPIPGVVLLGDGAQQVSVWRFPVDPRLPALVAAVDPERLRPLLRSLGVEVPPGAEVVTRVRAHRPMRRAVIEVGVGGTSIFLKVVPPAAASALHERHRALHDAGLPVPRPLGWSDEGMVALERVVGESMRQRMRGGGALPAVAALMHIPWRMPEAVMAWPHRPAWTDNAGHYADMIATALPEQGHRARALARRIAAGIADQRPDAPTHGDLHEGQLLLTGARITGLVDVDTVGPGRRADDLACLVAHAEVLALAPVPGQGDLGPVRDAWLEAADERVDPQELRWRVAGVLLSLATGPHRVQEPDWQAGTALRLDAVARWVDAAARGR